MVNLFVDFYLHCQAKVSFFPWFVPVRVCVCVCARACVFVCVCVWGVSTCTMVEIQVRRALAVCLLTLEIHEADVCSQHRAQGKVEYPPPPPNNLTLTFVVVGIQSANNCIIKHSVLARPKPQRGGGDFCGLQMQPKCIGRGLHPGPPTYTQSIFPGLTQKKHSFTGERH